MASETLNGLKVAILIEDGFEQVEMVEPRKALDHAGARPTLGGLAVDKCQPPLEGFASSRTNSATVTMPDRLEGYIVGSARVR